MALFSLFSPGRPREGEAVFLAASYCCFFTVFASVPRGKPWLFFPCFRQAGPAKGKQCF